MNIRELKTKWSKEKEFYKIQEVGSGVQIFVKEILKSEEIFALKEGLKSTILEKRKNELLEEEKTKAQRKADIVVYISSEIIIPVEVEKYQNIEVGKEQLFNYQADLDKKYGILTDGFTWRFYNNNVFREFDLNQILDTIEFFLEFWKEYIKSESYYLSFFEPIAGQQSIAQQSLFKESKLPVRYDELPVEQNLNIFFKDITHLIKSFNYKLEIEGYFENLDNKTKKKKAIEITYAYIIQFILYKTLVDNDFGEFKKEFENRVIKIHQYLKEKRYKDILGIINGISSQISENIYRPFVKEQGFIQNKLTGLYQKTENQLSDASTWLDIFVFIKKYNFANIQNEIFGYVYENYLKELYEEEKKGQYFTDPAVVNFMLQQIGFVPEEINKRYEVNKNSISLIDPACGSGTFLYSAVNEIIKVFGNHGKEKSEQIKEIVNNNIFGLDIEEFPLYLAEMNILMRMLPLIITEKYNNPIDKKIKVFKTKDSIAEFLDPLLNNQYSLFEKDIELEYDSYVREENDLKEMKKSMRESPNIPRRRFDYVIGNPPYVGYNECSKQGVLIIKLIQEKKAQMSNIYGVNLNTVPGRIKAYAPKPNLYAFFIALGVALLKDKGRLCYIVPQTILTSGDLDVLRYHLSKFTTIEKIITFSGKMFIGRGLKQDKPVATSSLIFVLNRETPSKSHQVEVINYEEPNDTIEETLQNILDNKKISKKKILQTKLFQNVANWNFIKKDKNSIDLLDFYNNENESMNIYRIYEISREKFNDIFIIDGSYNIPTKNILNAKKDEKESYYKIPVPNADKFTIDSFNYYSKSSEVKIAKGGQGLKIVNTKYKALWRYVNPNKFYFVEGDNVLPRFQQFCIGSNNRQEILYLFALLNTKLNNFILENYLRNENEKDILLGVKTIKEFVRVPKINEDNQRIKDEIIRKTEEMLSLEEKKLSDFVDFSKVMIQKFDKVSVESDSLILEKDNKAIEIPIKENKDLVKKVVTEKHSKQTLNLEEQKISLSELNDLPIIDYDEQQKLKDYIDDLVFALYFRIPIQKLGLGIAEEIKSECSKNPHYKLVSNQKL